MFESINKKINEIKAKRQQNKEKKIQNSMDAHGQHIQPNNEIPGSQNQNSQKNDSKLTEDSTLYLPPELMEKMPAVMERVKQEFSKDLTLSKLVDMIQFQPLMSSSSQQKEMPTYVFVINEGEMRPYPAKQINDREIIIDFGNQYEEIQKAIYGKTRKIQEGRELLRKRFFVGVNAHILTLPSSFFSHPSMKVEAPQYLHMRAFAMFWGEPFVRNFFTLDIVDKREKWEQLCNQNIADRVYLDEIQQINIIPIIKNKGEEEITQADLDQINENLPEKFALPKGVKLFRENSTQRQFYYKIKDEYTTDVTKPVYDINSFDFAKAEFFEQEMSKMIVMAIRALYEEFERETGGNGWYLLGFGAFYIISIVAILYFIPSIINASKKTATAFIMPIINFIRFKIGL